MIRIISSRCRCVPLRCLWFLIPRAAIDAQSLAVHTACSNRISADYSCVATTGRTSRISDTRLDNSIYGVTTVVRPNRFYLADLTTTLRHIELAREGRRRDLGFL